ncbi:MAG: hypothetical protein A2044_04105 [Candidatus Firestonebacteria bacterium GWA2_43_8]|nr:MAG: hypothetical protein A2044_04105 [Candidatus Firestonebacteria bacterium GWA2_43_8]
MKKMVLVCFLLLFVPFGGVLVAQNNVFTGSVRKSASQDNAVPMGQFGVTVAGVYSLPSGDIANVYNGAIGPELTLTYRNFLLNGLHLQLAGDYLSYTGKVDPANIFTNIIAKLSARYDFGLADIPGLVFLKAGGGADFETLTIGTVSIDNIDPIYSFGIGYETKCFDNFTLVFEFNYSLLPEKYIPGATRDGSFINIVIGLNCELGESSGSGAKRSSGKRTYNTGR